MNYIQKKLNEISDNFLKLYKLNESSIENASNLIIESLKNGGKVFFCGNGGSAADAQHLSAELLGRYKINRKPLAAIALTTDTSTITAIANDYSFDEIYSRQIDALAKKNDILYAISTSGESENIIKAAQMAKSKGIKTIGVTGQNKSRLLNECDILIRAPSNEADRIQEMHIAVGQIICDIVEQHFFR